MKHIKQYLTSIVPSTIIAFFFGSCNGFIEVDPPKTQIVSATVFTDDRTATSAISGIYATMISSGSFAAGNSGSITIQAGLSSDEYQNLSSSSISLEFSNNSLTPTNLTVLSLWSSLYQTIFYANSILEGLNESTLLTTSVKRQLEGEAIFIRAFSHFYLTNLFSDVPLVTSTNYRINSTNTRDSADKVYEQIVSDLIRASALLSEDYMHASGERVRPNKYTALALLSRVYLFRGQWQEAITTSSKVIEATSLYVLETDLNKVFLMNSQEAIWQLKPVQPQSNTNEGVTFRSLSFAAVSSSLNDAFESTDQRYEQWTTTRSLGTSTFRIPYKYKVGVSGQPLSEYSMVIRLAELYLIRAEAEAKLSNLDDAISDLNIIRLRAGLPEKNITTQFEVLDAIALERRVELFSEWGHRWFDLKRTQAVNQVLGLVKEDWQPSDSLYPVPKSERDNNPNLSQNQGY